MCDPATDIGRSNCAYKLSFSAASKLVFLLNQYRLPDASVNITFLVDDIAQLAARGAGGIEFLNYFDYGGLVVRVFHRKSNFRIL